LATVLLAAIGVVFCNRHFLFRNNYCGCFAAREQTGLLVSAGWGDLPCCENNNFGVRGVGRGLLATMFF